MTAPSSSSAAQEQGQAQAQEAGMNGKAHVVGHDHLAALLAKEPGLRDYMPVPAVQATIAQASTTIEIVQKACEVCMYVCMYVCVLCVCV